MLIIYLSIYLVTCIHLNTNCSALKYNFFFSRPVHPHIAFYSPQILIKTIIEFTIIIACYYATLLQKSNLIFIGLNHFLLLHLAACKTWRSIKMDDTTGSDQHII